MHLDSIIMATQLHSQLNYHCLRSESNSIGLEEIKQNV